MVATEATDATVSWRPLLRDNQVWALTTGYVFRSLAGTFFLTWYPSYLLDDRGFTEAEFGMVGAIPPIIAIGSTVLGGIVSDRMLAAGRSPGAARKVPIVAGLGLSACIGCAPFIESNLVLMIVLTVSSAAHSFMRRGDPQSPGGGRVLSTERGYRRRLSRISAPRSAA